MELFQQNPPESYALNISTKSTILLRLARHAKLPDEGEPTAATLQAKEYLELIDRYVNDLKITWYGRRNHHVECVALATENDAAIAQCIADALRSDLLSDIIADVLNERSLLPDTFRPRNGKRKTLLLKVVVKPQTGAFKISGHYIDQKLKVTDERHAEKLFNSLSPQTRDKVKDITVLVQGIRLNPFEERLLNAVIKLLNLKSDRSLKGNLPAAKNLYGGTLTDYPKLRITPHEFYSEVMSTKDYSGKDVQNIKEALMRLEEKKFLIMYQRHRQEQRGKNMVELIDVIEEYQSLIKVLVYYEGLTKSELNLLHSEEEAAIRSKGEIITLLNPVFIDQIDTKFIEYPDNVNLQTAIAAGGYRKVTTAMTQLRDYLLRAMSGNNGNKHIIDEQTLIGVLDLGKYAKQGRRALVKSRIEESIDLCKKINILESHREIIGVKGQLQYEFILYPRNYRFGN